MPVALRSELLRRFAALAPSAKGDDPIAVAEAALTELSRVLEQLPPIARTTIALVATRPRITRTDLTVLVHLRHGGAREDDAALVKTLVEALAAWPIVASPQGGLSMLNNVADAIRDVALQALAIPVASEVTRAEPAGVGRSLLAYALIPGLLLHRDARLTVEGALHAAAAKKLAKVVPEVEALTTAWLRSGALDRAENGALKLQLSRALRIVSAPAPHLGEMLGVGRPWVLELLHLAAAAPPGTVLDFGAALSTGNAQQALFALHAVCTPSIARFLPAALAVDVAHNGLTVPPDVAAALTGASAKSDDKSWVQPDFEVVLSPGVAMRDAFIIGCAAELHHLDQVARLRLTQKSVRTAASLGLDREQVSGALERIAQRPLPAPVATALREWGVAGTGQIHEVIALEATGTPQVLERAAEILRAATVRRAGDLFLLSRVPTAKELDALRTAGLFIDVTIERSRIRERTQVAEAQRYRAQRLDAELEPAARAPVFTYRRVDGAARSFDLHTLIEGGRLDEIVRMSLTSAGEHRQAPARATDFEASEGDDDDALDALDLSLRACARRWSHRRDWVDELAQLVARPEVQRALGVAPLVWADMFDTAQSPSVLQMWVAERLAEPGS